MPMRALFHLAYHVSDLDAARLFYRDVLGCAEGRSTGNLGRFRLLSVIRFRCILVSHLRRLTPAKSVITWCRCPIWGPCLAFEDWRALADRLEAANTDFVIPPSARFEGEPGEQWTMFFRDPGGQSHRDQRAFAISTRSSQADLLVLP
jgi:extradiol dioxygenase family protein